MREGFEVNNNAKKPAPRQNVRRTAAPQKRRKKKNTLSSDILQILGGILGVIAIPFQLLNRQLDRFRKGEASAIIVNSIAGAVVIVIVLGIFFLMKPSIDSSRAKSLAAKGRADKALSLVSALERKGYDEDKLMKTRIAVAEGLIESGNQDKAISLMEVIPEGEKKAELEKKRSYARAEEMYDAGDFTGAAQIFYQLNDYSDSALKYADCRCALSIVAWQEGNESSAKSLLLDVPDVAQRVEKAAVKIAGSKEAAQTILSADLYRAENLAEMERTMQNLSEVRSDRKDGLIAAGRYHTVAVTASGNVLATGDNSMGQCNVQGWTGVKQVAAGAFHTVVLKNDGTVMATGNNSKGQCDVSGWTDIVAIAAATADTIGLKSDGTVVAAGMHAGKVDGWRGATFVAGGSYSMGCLYDNGAMLSTHKGAQMDMGMVLYDLSVCGPVSVGVLYDGTMVSSFDGAPQWDSIVSATACESGIMAVDVDGNVKAHFYRPGDAVDMTIDGKAVAVESSGTHHVVLLDDGRVFAFGNNDYGQCNVSAWQLNQ